MDSKGGSTSFEQVTREPADIFTGKNTPAPDTTTFSVPGTVPSKPAKAV